MARRKTTESEGLAVAEKRVLGEEVDGYELAQKELDRLYTEIKGLEPDPSKQMTKFCQFLRMKIALRRDKVQNALGR